MAWKKVLPMEERIRFVLEAEGGEWNFSELCEGYGISRKTGYKWWQRYVEMGVLGMEERARRPKSSPQRTAQWLEELILTERKRRTSWGPKKLRERLKEKHGIEHPPAVSTIGAIVKRAGLVKERRRRRDPVRAWQGSHGAAQGPNEVWATDFKGWFRTRDGKRCDPLTISDLYSRYVLECRALADQTYERTRRAFERVFSVYGLPEALRMDNGSPFASHGLLGLSRLSVWWLELGIRLEYIEPGHPEQNGIHERMHKTLKAETARPPRATHRAQQHRFNDWREEFNHERPHEALGMKKPAELYQPATRLYPKRVPRVEYPNDWEVRRVRSSGEIKWQNRLRFIGQALVGRQVGLHEIDDGLYRVYLGQLALGILSDGDTKGLQPSP